MPARGRGRKFACPQSKEDAHFPGEDVRHFTSLPRVLPTLGVRCVRGFSATRAGGHKTLPYDVLKGRGRKSGGYNRKKTHIFGGRCVSFYIFTEGASNARATARKGIFCYARGRAQDPPLHGARGQALLVDGAKKAATAGVAAFFCLIGYRSNQVK